MTDAKNNYFKINLLHMGYWVSNSKKLDIFRSELGLL